MNLKALFRPVQLSLSVVLWVAAFALACHTLGAYVRVAWLDVGTRLGWWLMFCWAFVRAALSPWYYLDGAERWANTSVPWREVLTKVGLTAQSLVFHGAVAWLVWATRLTG